MILFLCMSTVPYRLLCNTNSTLLYLFSRDLSKEHFEKCRTAHTTWHSKSRLLPDLAPNTNWIQKLEAQIHLIIVPPFPEPSICLSKVPAKHPPLGFPTGASSEGAALPITFCYVSFPEPSVTCLLNPSIKVLLIKRNFTLLSKALGKERPSFPNTGLLLKQMPISRALLCISFLVHSRVALPPGSPLRAPSLRGVVFPEPFLIHL